MERIRYFNVETLSDLSKVKFSGDPGDTTYFTYSDTTLRQGAPDVAWHGVCTVAPVGQVYSHGKFYFPGRSGYSGTVYGVQWDTNDPSPECTRIGNLSLHATLPVQGKMVGGTMADDGTFTEFSNQGDWTGEVRDGSIGQVMVRIPTFWIKFETWGDVYKVLMSAVPVVGFSMVKEMYVSAYEASLDRTDMKLSSVANTSARYRGGNNNSSWDAEDTAGEGGESHRSLLGRPATGISLTDFRTYARKRGSTAWNCHFYLMQKTLYWLYVCEYATLNSQKAFNAALDANGFHQGGLGDGVSTWDGTSWSDFNNYYPFVPCGWTDSLGNGSGVRDYTVHDAAGTVLKTFSVPRYRGIENPWGHVWQHTDGILCQVNSGADGVSQVYATDDPAEFLSTSYSVYRFIGNELRARQYVSQLHLGATGDITAKADGGNSTSYYCDYHYCNVENSGLRAVLFGGGANDGARCGFVASNSNNAPSVKGASVGSRLCYFDAWKDVVYEEHEWLKGDGSAYIDTLVSDLTNVKNIYCKIKKPSDVSGISDTRVFGRELNAYPGTRLVVNFTGSYMSNITLWTASANVSPTFSSESGFIDIDFDTNIVSTHQSSVSFESYTNKSGLPIALFAVRNSSNYFSAFYKGSIGEFTIDQSMQLIPVRLLRPIPATLDANGIARDAGECGMWDKVGNKFYGNVASTGRFTVEGQRLYEEFDWLKGDGTAYIDTGVTSYNGVVDIKLSVGSFVGTILGRALGNDGDYSKRFFVGRYTSYGIYGNNQAPSTLIVNDLVLLTIDIENSVATDNYGNTTSISIIGNVVGNSMYLFCANKDNVPVTPIFNGKIGLFNISSIINLTPVRLLRPLPAYMDANGKPRAAGECGMWDKVSNKFYGNVASSGRFTVLNN